MTTERVERMTPDEINRVIAERVHGWHNMGCHWEELKHDGLDGNPVVWEAKAVVALYAPYHNPAQAMAALRKLPYDYQVLRECTVTGKPIWYVKIGAGETIMIGGDESEAAIISQAIVAAVMQE